MQLNDYVLVIADDDPEIRATYSALFTAKGYVVHTCADGLSAIALCREFRPAVALIDLDMPLLDGWETAKRLRGDADLANMRVVAITALSDERSSARAWDAGFHEFLPKPVPASMLLAIVRPTREMQGIIERG
jgi:chemosensory pili system protein ChpA (sensor histidine kinase/response regulator)